MFDEEKLSPYSKKILVLSHVKIQNQ